VLPISTRAEGSTQVIALSNFSDAATYSSYEALLAAAFPSVAVVPISYLPVDDAFEDGFASASRVPLLDPSHAAPAGHRKAST